MVAHCFLAILALLVSSPCSQAGEVHGQVLSDVLHKFFAKREAARKAAPTWKPQVEAMMSLVESMKDLQDQTPETKGSVTKLVTSIIELLEADVNRTKVAQEDAAGQLKESKSASEEKVTKVASAYSELKTSSTNASACHGEIAECKDRFFNGSPPCSADDISDAACQCTVNSVYDFELVPEAKEQRWCDFANQDTAQSCVDSLWVEVNKTRAALKKKHREWLAAVSACNTKRTTCETCKPKWDKCESDEGDCEAKHESIYGAYRTFQTLETEMCTADQNLANHWTTAKGLQTSRAEEWSDLKFVICIFGKFNEEFNFTQTAFESCKDDIGEPDFYAFADELQQPVLDMSVVPACDRTRTKKLDAKVEGLCPGGDQGGLCFLWKLDGCGTYSQVTINTGNIFAPNGSGTEMVGKC
jgi:hypothetical protein